MIAAGAASAKARPIRPEEAESFRKQRSAAATACMRTLAQGLSCLSPIPGARTPLSMALTMLALGADLDPVVDILVTAARSASTEGESDPFFALAIDAAKACALGYGAAWLDTTPGAGGLALAPTATGAGGQALEVDGDAVIPGSVADGAVIRASGSIRVAGNVGAATLEAGASATIGGVVHGKDAASISCGGNFLARAVERAQVAAGGDIILRAGASYAALECGGDLDCGGSASRLVGARALAGGSVRAGSIGAPLCDATVVKAGQSSRDGQEPVIDVAGRLHPNVLIELGGRIFSVNEAYDRVSVVIDGPMLRLGSLEDGGRP